MSMPVDVRLHPLYSAGWRAVRVLERGKYTQQEARCTACRCTYRVQADAQDGLCLSCAKRAAVAELRRALECLRDEQSA